MSLRFAFADFYDMETAEKFIDDKNVTQYKGRTLHTRLAENSGGTRTGM